MTKKERVKLVIETLDTYYPTDTKCYLHYETPWQLLIATILSAQCTDDRVNIVTPSLFAKYPTIEAFAFANPSDIEEGIKSTGYYHAKARYIIGSMGKLLRDYGGEMPSQLEDLLTFPGVGRKTANVVRTHVFNIPSIVVDTHVKRVTNRSGLTKESDPVKIEFDLMKILPEDHWSSYNTQIIAHGRAICTARKAKCEICPFTHCCQHYGINSRGMKS